MANYRMKDGQQLGLVTTLRGNMMHSFLDRLINLGLPRTFDLQCSTPSSFDELGTCRIRIHEQSMFPEDRCNEIGKLKGVNVCIRTSMKTNKETQNLLARVAVFPSVIFSFVMGRKDVNVASDMCIGCVTHACILLFCFFFPAK
ncbi:50S ribosomal protein L5 [Euphorbia peplus]|nr:50S ribosomal protein L5 [Euphorbia peplus]